MPSDFRPQRPGLEVSTCDCIRPRAPVFKFPKRCLQTLVRVGMPLNTSMSAHPSTDALWLCDVGTQHARLGAPAYCL